MYQSSTYFLDALLWFINVGMATLLVLFCMGIWQSKAPRAGRLAMILTVTLLASLLNGAARYVVYLPEEMRVEAMMPELTQRALEQRKLWEGK